MRRSKSSRQLSSSARIRFSSGAAGGSGLQQLCQDRFVAAALLLQEFDVCIEPRQRDSVIEIDRVGDQFVQVLARLGELLVARLR
jgi:hypothetical protein